MLVHIPQETIEKAITDARIDLAIEVIGFFVLVPQLHMQGEGSSGYSVEWRLASNIWPDPYRGSEVAGEEMSRMILDEKVTPIAMFHSHPSGDSTPSDQDWDGYPSMYVDVAFVWTRTRPLMMREYLVTQEYRLVHINEVFVHVQV